MAQVNGMLCRFNAVRAAAGIPPLVEDPQLMVAAKGKLDEIVEYRHLSHAPNPNDPNPFTILKEDMALTPPWTIAENIAMGAADDGRARIMFNDWWWSPPHRANILDGRLTNVGFAIRHFRNITMDVDQENGPTIPDEALRNETIWVAEFWGPNQ